MPIISGQLKLVTDKPALVSEVWVRSAELRPYGTGVLTAFNDTVSVADGEVSFTAVPGAAVLVLVQLGGPQVAVPIIVEESPARQTLYQVIKNAEMVEGRTADELAAVVKAINDTLKSADSVAAQIAADAKAADAAARNARGGESGARSAESGAAKSASAAAESAKSAAALEAGAQGAQAAAAESAKSAATSEENARSYAATAAQHEVAASGHADTAKREADRTATIAGSTRWVGTRLEVNGKLSPDLKGEKGEKGDKGDPGRDGTVEFDELTEVQRDSLRGEDGAPGRDGRDGRDGSDGEDGAPGIVIGPTQPTNGAVWLDTSRDGEALQPYFAGPTLSTPEQALQLPIGVYAGVAEVMERASKRTGPVGYRKRVMKTRVGELIGYADVDPAALTQNSVAKQRLDAVADHVRRNPTTTYLQIVAVLDEFDAALEAGRVSL